MRSLILRQSKTVLALPVYYLLAFCVCLWLVTNVHAATAAGTSSASMPALRVLPFGDSLTFGQRSWTGDGYRGALRRELIDDGYATDFVGTVLSNHASNCQQAMYDCYSEGHPGNEIYEMYSSPYIDRISNYQPNVITLMLGTNDLLGTHDGKPAKADTALQRMTTLLQDIFSRDPNATVLLATLIVSQNSTIESTRQAYNQGLPGLIQGRHIIIADMSAVTTIDLSDDGIHPYDFGYLKMAKSFHAALGTAVSNGWVQTPEDCWSIPAGCSDGSIQAGSAPPGAPYVPVPGQSTPVNTATPPNATWINLGQVASGVSGTTSQNVQLIDMNGDGKADYVIVGPEPQAITVYYNQGGDGGGGWSSPIIMAAGVDPQANLLLADLNHDGKADYLKVDPLTGVVDAWINNGGDSSGGWIALGILGSGVGQPGSSIRFADLNGDGFADYVVLDPNTGSLTAWQNDGGDTSPSAKQWIGLGQVATGVGYSGSNVLLADINGDGWADYIVIDPTTGAANAWLNQGRNPNTGGWNWKPLGQISPGLGAPNSTDTITFADFDGDGKADYIRIYGNGAVRVLLNQGIDNSAR